MIVVHYLNGIRKDVQEFKNLDLEIFEKAQRFRRNRG